VLLLFLLLLLLLLSLLLLLLLRLRLMQVWQLPLQAAFFFFFFFPPLFLILLPPLLDGVMPEGPWCSFLNVGGLDLLVRGASVCRVRTTTRPITDSDGVTHSPKLGWLGGSLLALGARRLDPSR